MSTATQVTPAGGFSNFGKDFGTAWIVSVYWAKQKHSIANKAHVQRGGRVIPAGYSAYELPASKRDGYSLLRVDDGAVFQSDFSNGDDRPPGRIHVPQTGQEIAAGLVDKWTGHSVAGAGMIGIAVLPPEAVAGFDDQRQPIPTEDFLAKLRKDQEPRAAAWIDKAADLHRNGRSNAVTEHMRDACRWLHGEASNRFDWMHAKVMEANKKCPACSREILRGALVCEHCQTSIAKFYTENGYTIEEVAEIDPIASESLRRMHHRKFAVRTTAQTVKEKIAERWGNQPEVEEPPVNQEAVVVQPEDKIQIEIDKLTRENAVLKTGAKGD